MPKANSIKVLKKADFVYSPVYAKEVLSTIQSNAPEQQERDKMTAQNSLIRTLEQQSKTEERNNTEVIDMTRDAQFDFPRGNTERQKYRTKAGKKVTQYQWDVYDFILKIPRGQVTTYKVVSGSVGGSSRSVGGALRINPFSPYVPCHRVVASNMFIGGFSGKWAGRQVPHGSTKELSFGNEPPEIQRKLGYLQDEGVSVDKRGFLVDGDGDLVWRPDSKVSSNA